MEPEETPENEPAEEYDPSSEPHIPADAAPSETADVDVADQEMVAEHDADEDLTAETPETSPAEEPSIEEQSADELEESEPDLSGESVFEDIPLDIDAALAAVAELHEAIAEQEAEIETEFDQLDATAEEIEDERLETSAREAAKAAFVLPRPPLVTVERGQSASILAALALMGLGAWLTFTQAVEETSLNAEIITVTAMFGLGIALLGYWLTSARWARGALFGGLACVGGAAAVLILAQPDSPGADGWPLLIAALGGAVFLSGIIALPVARNQSFFGLLLIIAGIAGYAVSAELLGTTATDSIKTAAPFVLLIGALVLLAPAISRRR